MDRRVGAKSAEGGLDPEAARLAHSISVVVQGRSGACQKRVADTDGGGPAITRAPRSRVFIMQHIYKLYRALPCVVDEGSLRSGVTQGCVYKRVHGLLVLARRRHEVGVQVRRQLQLRVRHFLFPCFSPAFNGNVGRIKSGI
uniref:Uncharacterized protein n=1 Tax=Homalodisca liturata TaxID=320908 RepID=A0A1B6JWW8_9HEMI